MISSRLVNCGFQSNLSAARVEFLISSAGSRGSLLRSFHGRAMSPAAFREEMDWLLGPRRHGMAERITGREPLLNAGCGPSPFRRYLMTAIASLSPRRFAGDCAARVNRQE